MYDIELQGNVIVRKTAKNHDEIRKATSGALGSISICKGDREVFFGNRGQLLDRLEWLDEDDRAL